MPSKLFNHSHALKMLAKFHNQVSRLEEKRGANRLEIDVVTDVVTGTGRRVDKSLTPVSTPGSARTYGHSDTLFSWQMRPGLNEQARPKTDPRRHGILLASLAKGLALVAAIRSIGPLRWRPLGVG